ncbi:MAG: PIG-L family deacetylase [Lachnospiraceae bacterium]|nr:PIG-L family deacetylase [Lachnospiraceae bacterium]
MSLLSLVLKAAAPTPKIEDFDRYLFVGPHPDDIEVGAGATAARLISLGKSVSFLICLDGRYGLEHAPEGTTPEALAAIRRQESLESASKLGVSDVRFLDLSDGGQYDIEDLRNGIARVIGEVQPDVVFAPDPDVDSECHTDHLNVGGTVKKLAFFAPFQEIMAGFQAKSAPVKAVAFYMTAKPNRFVKTTAVFPLQLAALLCHKTQFPEDSEAFRQVKLYLTLRAVSFGLRSFRGKAEGFRVLGVTQMHCLPEAG